MKPATISSIVQTAAMPYLFETTPVSPQPFFQNGCVIGEAQRALAPLNPQLQTNSFFKQVIKLSIPFPAENLNFIFTERIQKKRSAAISQKWKHML